MRCSPTRTPRGPRSARGATCRRAGSGRARSGPTRTRTTSSWASSSGRSTDRPLAKEIRARLLDPLGLEHAWYQAAEKPRTRAQHAATGWFRDRPAVRAPSRSRRPSDVMPFRSVVTAAGGAGSIAATAEDTARWMQAFAGGRVLSPAMQTAMLGDVAYTRALHARIPYGLGIQQRVDRGPARARPLRPLPRLPQRGPLPAGGRRDDRGAHQPGGRRSRRWSPRSC